MPTEPQPDLDPNAPLPGMSDPWASAPTPSLRPGPPYHMTDMIAAEPAVARRIVARLSAPGGGAAELATAIRAALSAGDPVVVTGCGTSEHAALGTVDILREASGAGGLSQATILSEQAFELSLEPPARGLVIGISHEGGTAATIAAMAAARAAGARTALVTATRRSRAAAVGAELSGRPLDGEAVSGLLAAGTRGEVFAEGIAERLAGAAHLIVIASGADRTAGRELVLKIEEASWIPSAYRDLETFLHGHLPATGADTGLILVLADRDGRDARSARARGALAAARVLGVRTAAILAADLDAALDPALTPAGRLLVTDAPDLPAPVAALLGTATPLQLLTERLARARGTNPDLIRRDDPVYRASAEAADE